MFVGHNLRQEREREREGYPSTCRYFEIVSGIIRGVVGVVVVGRDCDVFPLTWTTVVVNTDLDNN